MEVINENMYASLTVKEEEPKEKQQLSISDVKRALPVGLKVTVTQALVDKLNKLDEDPIIANILRDNFISYTHVMADGKFKIEDYLNAVKYVSFKLMGCSNQDAYFKTFPDRYISLKSKGASAKDISAYVSAFAKGKLVNIILEQSLVPSWVLNQDIYQQAINTQAFLMANGKSERVRCMAADSILGHLAKPTEAGPLININMREDQGLRDLQNTLVKLAETQQDLIRNGISPKTIAEQKIIEDEVIDVTESN